METELKHSSKKLKSEICYHKAYPKITIFDKVTTVDTILGVQKYMIDLYVQYGKY